MNLVEKLIAMVGEQHKYIIVVGDVMVDRWVHGHLESSQDGCQKFVQVSTCDTIGGAGNAERSLSNWGVTVQLCGHWEGKRGVKTRFVDQEGKIVFRHDADVIAGGEYNQTRKNSLEWVGCADAVLLSDYDKGFLTEELIQQVVTICHMRDVPCVADCKRDPAIYAGCVRKCNFPYSVEWADPCEVCTDGSGKPMVGGHDVGGDLSPVKLVNHVGAGDCFAAHLALALAYGFSLEGAAAVAHSAGRIYVQHPHSRPPYPREIADDMATST